MMEMEEGGMSSLQRNSPMLPLELVEQQQRGLCTWPCYQGNGVNVQLGMKW